MNASGDGAIMTACMRSPALNAAVSVRPGISRAPSARRSAALAKSPSSAAVLRRMNQTNTLSA